jgi:hypothetical protein
MAWAEPSSRFTALFELPAIEWLKAANQKAVAGLLKLSWDEIHGIMGSNFLLFDGIAFAHQRTQDARLRQVLLAGTETAVKDMPSMGKSFTQYTRVTPHFIGYLAELQERAAVIPAMQGPQ